MAAKQETGILELWNGGISQETQNRILITKTPFDCAPFDLAQGLRQDRRKRAGTETGLLEFSSIEPGLPDNRLQGANPNCIVVGNGDGDGA